MNIFEALETMPLSQLALLALIAAIGFAAGFFVSRHRRNR